MADEEKSKKPEHKKLSLEEYEKIKDKRAKQREQLDMPWFMNAVLLIPLATVIILLLIYTFYAKNLPVR